MAVGLGFGRLLGEPPNRFHPMVHIGRLLERLEDGLYQNSRQAGALFTASSVSCALLGSLVLQKATGRFAANLISVWIASAEKMLGDVALEVEGHLERSDLESARSSMKALVGRDLSNADEADICRAVIESLAENTVDAVTATLVWSQLAGSAGVWVHRVSNTLDAMVGHRNDRYRRFGWSAARLDDGLNWIPARLTVIAIVLCSLMPDNAQPFSVRRAVTVLKSAREGVANHPSPNGGMVEAAFAAALGLELLGANSYGGATEIRGPLGCGRSPEISDIKKAVALAMKTSTAVGLMCLSVGAGFGVIATNCLRSVCPEDATS